MNSIGSTGQIGSIGPVGIQGILPGIGEGRILRKRIAAAIKRRNAAITDAQIDDAIASLESERPLMDWLLNGGIEKIIELIIMIITAI